MKILPILPSINANNYNSSRLNNNVNSTSFNGRGVESSIDTYAQDNRYWINNKTIQSGDDWGRKYSEMLDHFKATLTEYGFDTDCFWKFNPNNESANLRFQELMKNPKIKKARYEVYTYSERLNRVFTDIHDVIALHSNTTPKTKTNPVAEIQIYRMQRRNELGEIIPNDYEFGIKSYADADMRFLRGWFYVPYRFTCLAKTNLETFTKNKRSIKSISKIKFIRM